MNVEVSKKNIDPVASVTPANQVEKKADTSESVYNIPVEGYKATSLGDAIHSGDLEKVKGLIERGATIEQCLTDETYIYDALHTALTFGKMEIIRYIIANKLYADVNKTYTEEAETPLSLACTLKNNDEAFQISDLLISLGANVNGSGASGGEYTMYPLILAVRQNNLNLVKLLTEHGANKDITDENGNTPLSVAEKNGFIDIVNFLKG